MKKIVYKVIAYSCVTFFIVACGSENSDGSLKSTYSSCKITSSSALLAADREKDLSQCWNASGDGYESAGDAKQWCASEANTYISNTYLIGHSVEYSVDSTYCK